MEELPRGDKTSVVTLKSNIEPGTDEWGQGGNRNSPATRDSKGSSKTSRGEEMANEQEAMTMQIPQRGMAGYFTGNYGFNW